MSSYQSIDHLLGQTIIGVAYCALDGKRVLNVQDAPILGDNAVMLYLGNGQSVYFSHTQDCCETVDLVDVCGDWDDLLHEPLVMAEVVTNEDNVASADHAWASPSSHKEGSGECMLWTFYRFSTQNGCVVFRFLGESNGYYSVEVKMSTEDTEPHVHQQLLAQWSKQDLLAHVNTASARSPTPKL